LKFRQPAKLLRGELFTELLGLPFGQHFSDIAEQLRSSAPSGP